MSEKKYDAAAFPRKLKTFREFCGMTQQELADLAGLKPSQISNFECSERTPNLENLVKLCRALKCTADHLLTP